MIDRTTPLTPGPLRRMVDVASVGPEGSSVTIEASDTERRALAAANTLVEVVSFVARLRLLREGRTGIAVTGEVDAVVRQTCVVTLEAFETALTEPVAIHFLPERELDALQDQLGGDASAAPGLAAHARADDGDEEPDLPDPIVNGRIDVGAVAAEFFTLGLDPYPRKPGASFAAPAEEAKVSPFAALARLRDMKDT